jgi:chromosome condensin MukBEF ATPase and DNA-binding subunit MukB
MARKRSAREEADSSKPRQLRKRLRKAEDQLADAVQKRDRAQARVEALNIIADEIRAQLADLEKSEKAADAEQDASALPTQPARAPRRAGKVRGRSDDARDGQASAPGTPDAAG